jgi:acyl-CoA thioester hydrolase
VSTSNVLAKSHTVEFRVRYSETDQMGVVYHSEYLVWCEVGRTEFIRALGLPYAEMERRGAFLAVADASLRFHAPARYDDLVRVETTLTSLKSRAITFDYVIRHAETGTRLVSAQTMLVSLDGSGRPAPIPADVRDLLSRALVPGA